MKYNVNYRTVISNLTPAFLRSSKFTNLLYSLIKGISDLNADLGKPNYFLNFTNQVIYMEKFLNDTYDPSNNRIYISNNQKTFVVMFNRVELRLENTYLFNRSESAVKTYFKNRFFEPSINSDYVVFIPASLSPLTDKITASINLLNPADKTFEIQTI
jgi:hypothetical protein